MARTKSSFFELRSFDLSKIFLEKSLISLRLAVLISKSYCSEKSIKDYSKFNICSSLAIMITFKTDLLISFKMTFVFFSIAF